MQDIFIKITKLLFNSWMLDIIHACLLIFDLFVRDVKLLFDVFVVLGSCSFQNITNPGLRTLYVFDVWTNNDVNLYTNILRYLEGHCNGVGSSWPSYINYL